MLQKLNEFVYEVLPHLPYSPDLLPTNYHFLKLLDSFLNASKTITFERYAQQINEMHRKLHHPQPALGNRLGPVLLHDNARPQVTQPMLQKLNELGFEVLPHPPYSSDLLPIDYHFFQHFDNFFQGKRFYNQQEAENAFPEFSESRSMDFYCIGISKFISHWQKMC